MKLSHEKILLSVLCVAALFCVYKNSGRSNFVSLSPGPVGTDDPNNPTFKQLLDLKYGLECVPGKANSMDAGYYSKGLLPGGICGGQAYVAKNMHGYKISSGIGDRVLGE
tara:strand:- start:672 stop:1001 length:330 start_codon:yes stop_codon:yes gene_type:complete